jgi:hypothetical protein
MAACLGVRLKNSILSLNKKNLPINLRFFSVNIIKLEENEKIIKLNEANMRYVVLYKYIYIILIASFCRGWKLVSGRDAITKTFIFENFFNCFVFMGQVAIVSEKMNHHPGKKH